MEAQGFPVNQENEDPDDSYVDPNKYSKKGNVKYFGKDYMKAVEGSKVILVLTEWDEFNSYDYEKLG